MRPEDGELTELLGKERILMVAWMLPDQGVLSDSQRSQAMANFAGYLRRNHMTAADVAHQLGRPRATTITDLMKGVYRANADEHVRRLNLFIEQHARARAASLTDRFVNTKVANDILAVARLARENATLALCIGPTGIGKSRCAMAVHEKYPGSIYLRINHGSRQPKGLAGVLAEQLGVRTGSGIRDKQHRTQLERCIAALRNSHRLLIIDEAHKMTNEAIELLRDIHDSTGAPAVLLATKDLHQRILRDADADHGQLYSRFDVIHHLTEGRDVNSGGKPLYSIEDIRALYNEPPIRLASDAAKYLQDVANALGFGSLRRCKTLLSNAARRARKRQDVAAGDKVTVTACDLEWAELRLRQDATEQDVVAERRRRAAGAASA